MTATPDAASVLPATPEAAYKALQRAFRSNSPQLAGQMAMAWIGYARIEGEKRAAEKMVAWAKSRKAQKS